MSKTKTLRITVIAVITALLLALSAWAAVLPARANDGDAETPSVQQIVADNITIATEVATFNGDINAIIIDFGLTGATDNLSFVYFNAGGWGYGSYGAWSAPRWDQLNAQISLTRGEDNRKVTYYRYIEGQGKIAFDWTTAAETDEDGRCKVHANNSPVTVEADCGKFLNGDKLTIKSGLKVHNVGAPNGAAYADSATVLGEVAGSEDLVFTYKSGKWYAPGEEVPADPTIHNITINNVSHSGENVFVRFSPFEHAGSGAGETPLPNEGTYGAQYIEIELADGTVAKPSHIRTEPGSGFKLYFHNNGWNTTNPTNELLEGAVITIKEGLQYAGASGDIYKLATTAKFTCISGDWYAEGVTPEQIKAEDITIATTAAPFGGAGEAVVIDFGLTTDGDAALIDKDPGGWPFQAQSMAYWNELQKYFTYTRGTREIEYSRFVRGQGKIAFDWGFANSEEDKGKIVTGDVITLKQGLKVSKVVDKYTIDVFGVSWATATETVGILSEDAIFIYNGSAWVAPVYATSATVTNETDIRKLCVNQQIQMTYAINDGAIEPFPTFTSSDDSIASVSKTGVITAKAEGEVTITVQYENVSATVTFTVNPALKVNGLKIETGDYAGKVVKDGVAYVRAYKGEPLALYTKQSGENTIFDGLVGRFVYENGAEASGVVELTPSMLATTGDAFTCSGGKYTFTKTGAQTITVTTTEPEGATVTATIPVWVYDEPRVVEHIAANRIGKWDVYLNLWFADVVGGGEEINVKTLSYTEDNIKKYSLMSNMTEFRTPALATEQKTYTISTMGHVSQKQMIIHFGGIDGNDLPSTVPVGAVLTLTENFRFYKLTDDDWVAVYKFAEPVSFVWTGTQWADYVADATDFTLAQTELTVPQHAIFTPDYTVSPANAYMSVVYSSDDTDVIEVKNNKLFAKGAGTATVTVTMGTVSRTLAITVTESSPQGMALVNNRTFYVAEGGTLDITKIRVKVKYGTGSDGKDYYGDEIELSADNTTFTMPETAGTHVVPVEVTVPFGGSKYTGTVNVNVDVQPNREIYVENFMFNLDPGYFLGDSNLTVVLGNFGNGANVYIYNAEKSFEDHCVVSREEQKTVTDHVHFVRDGRELDIVSANYLLSMLVFAVENNGTPLTVYNEGDKIILDKGLTFYRWFGDTDGNNLPVGEGDYVKAGELKYEVVFTFGSNKKFSWDVAPADGIVKEATVKVGLGKTHGSNVETVPSYATDGEWFFDVEDSSIAKINTQGLITGVKIGTTKVTAKLKTRAGDTIQTVEFTIEVTDIEDHLEITSDKPVTVATGTALDVASLIEEFGIKANVILSSGAKGDEVDITKARVTGYNADVEGEQTLTFRITVNGTSVSGTLKITVGNATATEKKDKGCGCGSNAYSVGSVLAGGGILIIAAFVLARRKKNTAK